MRAVSNYVAMRLTSAAGSLLGGLALVVALGPGALQAQQSEVADCCSNACSGQGGNKACS